MSRAFDIIQQDSARVIIFDTTLRDGEQSPGCAMSLEDKLAMAVLLDELGVDVIEAGFPVASVGDFDAVYAIANTIKNATICGLARAKKGDIEAVAKAIAPAIKGSQGGGRIHTFIGTSPLHMQYQLQMSSDEVLANVTESVEYARGFTDDVEWSAMDATRTEEDFLCHCVEAAIKAGATTINIPDTVGYATPAEFGAQIKMLFARVPNIDRALISTHCHNDLRLAVANSLAGLQNGARQIECTINGIGERAGNAALEEIVMALHTRADLMPYTNKVETTNIVKISRALSTVTGFTVQPNKAIVGVNAFAHASGIHQDGVLKHAQTYEIMTPESVGLIKNNLVLAKHSGRAAFRSKLEELGFTLDNISLNEAFARFKTLADSKREIFEEDILALISDEAIHKNDTIRFVSLSIRAGSAGPQTADICLDVEGKDHCAKMEGNGPVDAIFKAIRAIHPHPEAHLKLYQVHAVTGGTDAQAEVTVRLEEDGKMIDGHSADVDTLVASAKAYLNALNKLLAKRESINPQRG